MKPLYPAWSNSLFRWSLGLTALSIAAVPALLMLGARTTYATGESTPREQPIKFDHRHHVRDDGIDCKYCHVGVTESAYAGVPPTSLCMGCHAQIWPNSPELTKLRDSYFRNDPIVWRRVNALPDHVYFNHAIHVSKGVGCVSCHGRVDLMPQVFQAEPLTMGWCLDCHRDPAAHLRPLDRITDMEWVPDRPQRELGRTLMNEYAVAPRVDCSACHR